LGVVEFVFTAAETASAAAAKLDAAGSDTNAEAELYVAIVRIKGVGKLRRPGTTAATPAATAWTTTPCRSAMPDMLRATKAGRDVLTFDVDHSCAFRNLHILADP